VVILFVALGIRLLAIGGSDNYRLLSDSRDYQRHAVSIMNGDGYPESIIAPEGGPTAFRPPLYPYYMGAIYTITRPPPKWNLVRASQAFLGTLIVALIALIAFRIWGQREALLAAGIAAVYPPLVIYGGTILTETLFVTLELGALAAAIEYRRRQRSYPWLLLAGVLVGLAALARSNGILLLLPLIVAVWPSGAGNLWSRVARPAALVGVTLLVLVPWSVRNAIEFDAFVPAPTQSGYAIAGTYNEQAQDDPDRPAAWRRAEQVPEFDDLFEAGTGLDERELDGELRDRAMEFAIDNPLYVAEVGARNTLRLFDLAGFDHAEEVWSFAGVKPLTADLGVVGFYLMIPFVLIGAFTAAARRAPLFIWLTPLVLFLSVIFIADSGARYRAPIDPFLILLAALGLAALLDRLRARRRGEAAG
jgi:4-amino-4-deoxy-L-arabinose transferase-like glycosyltransferase